MKNYSLIMLLFLFVFSSCILEDEEEEYQIVGAIGTISTVAISNSSPAVGETVQFDVTFFSEHEAATELRMNRVDGSASNLETRTFSTWNTEDSYVETFTFTVPAGTAGTTITIQFEIVTESGYSNSRNFNLSVAE